MIKVNLVKMSKSISLFLLCISFLNYAQVKIEKIETDSSLIEVKTFEYLNSIRTFNELKDGSKTYFKDVYFDTKNQRTEGIFVNGYSVGIWTYYLNNGIVEKVIDYDNGSWEVTNRSDYKYYELQNRIRKAADSIIISNYGKQFFQRYIVWDFGRSAIYNKDESGNWDERFTYPPNEFLLRFKIMLKEDEVYNLMEIHLNDIGHIIFPNNLHTAVMGFENVNHVAEFRIDKEYAVSKAKELGLVESDSNKAFCFLSWKYYDDNKMELNNGYFVYKVLILTNVSEEILMNDRKRYIRKYDSYEFNPWTNEFIRMNKLKKISEQGNFSGYTSGFLPDE